MGKQSPRGNEQWLQQLNRTGPDQEDALVDLYGILVRGLGYALTKYPKVARAHVHEFAYEALLKILATLHSFRGESRFTTWALKIAVRTAFAELRRRRWCEEELPFDARKRVQSHTLDRGFSRKDLPATFDL